MSGDEVPLLDQAGPVRLGGSRRRDWAVVLYGGDVCEDDPGLRCAAQAFGPCTLAECDDLARAVPAGFHPHRVALVDPAEYLEAADEEARPGPRGARGDPAGDPPV
jgi:hypothetical protein